MKRRKAKRFQTVHRHSYRPGQPMTVTILREIVPRRIDRLRRFLDNMHDREPDGPFWDDSPRITWRCRNKASAGRKRR